MCCNICQGCAVFFRWLVFGWLITGILFSLLTLNTCHFLDYGGNNGMGIINSNNNNNNNNNNNSNNTSSSEISLSGSSSSSINTVGIFMFRNATGQCEFFPDDRIFDDQELVARYAAMIAPGAATGSFVLLSLECLCFEFSCFRCCLHPLIAIGLIIAQVCQGLTFLLFGSETFCGGNIIHVLLQRGSNCTFATGSAYSLAALVLYFLSGVFVLCTPSPDPICQCSGGGGGGKDGNKLRPSSSSSLEKSKGAYSKLPTSSSEDGTAASSACSELEMQQMMMQQQQHPFMMGQPVPPFMTPYPMQMMMMNPATAMAQQYPMMAAPPQYAMQHHHHHPTVTAAADHHHHHQSPPPPQIMNYPMSVEEQRKSMTQQHPYRFFAVPYSDKPATVISSSVMKDEGQQAHKVVISSDDEQSEGEVSLDE